ncbi:hypothetical protein ACNSTU_11295 [Aquisalimonas sp. APHAB1-3]|uniref:hypothetical protein n=1 Tax=Aquisalimonas sp. APHAB1-3 TaxID=3402080 RepID=UPI003AB0EF4B
MRGTITTTLALFGVVFILTGCLGSADVREDRGGEANGSTEPPDDDSQNGDVGVSALHGVYEGVLEVDGDAGGEDFLYIVHDGRAMGLLTRTDSVYDGTIDTDEEGISGTFSFYGEPGVRTGQATFTGERLNDVQLQGEWVRAEGDIVPGAVELYSHPQSERNLIIEEDLAGTYGDESSENGNFQLTVHQSGSFEGFDGSGCWFDGTVDVAAPNLNIVSVELTQNDGYCDGLPGDAGERYDGFATLVDDGLLLSVVSDDHRFVRVLADLSSSEPDRDTIPSWLESLPERAWSRVNTNSPYSAIQTLDERTDGCGRSAYTGRIERVWEAFAGSAWDPTRKVAWIFGGGHAVTTFNAPIAIDVFEREWQILHNETTSINADFHKEEGSARYVTGDYQYDYQGAPVSAHAYDNNEYLPVADRFITFGGATAGPGSWWRKYLDTDGTQWSDGDRLADAPRTGPYVYDYGRRDPTRVGGHDGTAVDVAGCDNAEIKGARAWTNLDFMEDIHGGQSTDRSTVCRVENGNDVCYHSRTRLERVEFDGYDATVESAGTFGQGHIGAHSSVIAPVGDNEIFLQIRLRPEQNSWELKWWEIQDFPDTRASQAIRQMSGPSVDFSDSSYGTSGPLPDEGNLPGSIYDSERDRIIIWRGGRNLYELLPPENLGREGWRMVDFDNNPVSAVAPDVSGGTGNESVFGHFHYDAEWDLYFGIEGIHGDLWVYKPKGWNSE